LPAVAAELKPVYLLSGNDRPKVARALERLRQRFDAAAVERLDASESGGENAVAACNALGLFGGGGRLVVAEGVERWKAADAKAVAAYLENPAPATVLALVGEDVKADSPLAKTCARRGDVLVFHVPKRELPQWVGEQFARLGARADQAACRALAESVGEDLDRLATEVDKIATWAGGEPVGEQEIKALSAGGAETSRFALTDAWGRRDLPAALSDCEALLEQSDRPLDQALPLIVGALRSHVHLVRACRELDAQGIGPRAAAERLGKHAFSVGKAFAHARNYSGEERRDAVVRLAALDLALKGGSRLAGELETERALIEITRPAAAGGRADPA
jgi:DNA polymerase-3 subunit delta